MSSDGLLLQALCMACFSRLRFFASQSHILKNQSRTCLQLFPIFMRSHLHEFLKAISCTSLSLSGLPRLLHNRFPSFLEEPLLLSSIIISHSSCFPRVPTPSPFLAYLHFFFTSPPFHISSAFILAILSRNTIHSSQVRSSQREVFLFHGNASNCSICAFHFHLTWLCCITWYNDSLFRLELFYSPFAFVSFLIISSLQIVFCRLQTVLQP